MNCSAVRYRYSRSRLEIHLALSTNRERGPALNPVSITDLSGQPVSHRYSSKACLHLPFETQQERLPAQQNLQQLDWYSAQETQGKRQVVI